MEREETTAIFKNICTIPCDDGMRFLSESVQAAEIREDARYGGIRIDLAGMLGNARCPVQIDIGYGDVVTPDPELVRYPALLEGNPVPVLKAYPRETVLAEKLEAIVRLGMANSRMKDFFDLYILIQDYPVDRRLAAEAIRRTFERRGTPIPESLPVGLGVEFARDRIKQVQWNAFISKNKLEAAALEEVVATARGFWLELLS